MQIKHSVLEKFGRTDENNGAGVTRNKQYKSSFQNVHRDVVPMAQMQMKEY